MRLARALLVFSYGLFTIAAQALLFREFISSLEGDDIAVGLFFFSWFLWVALGAVLINKARGLAEALLKKIELAFLLYLPAFVLQWALIVQVRELAGIESYELLSLRAIVLLSVIVNAPLSLLTGILFPLACQWLQKHAELAVSHVYVLEAAGSFAGGLGVTVLLAMDFNSVTIFAILALILSLAALGAQLSKNNGIKKTPTALAFTAVICACLAGCLYLGLDKRANRYIQTLKWGKLLPKETLAGSFQTAQAEYLYGHYHGQWVVVRQGSAIETLPDESTHGKIAALALSQNPHASRILVVGSGLGLCRQFLKLPQVDAVTWAYCDSEYIRRIDEFVPKEFKVNDSRLSRVAGDIRQTLTSGQPAAAGYDIVIINLPDATSSVLNRYYSLEWYQQIKDSLRPNGIVAVRVSAGENVMGTELVNLGASVKVTLEQVFAKTVLVPGEDSWFIASDSANLSGEPGTLKQRFAKIEGSKRIFPANGLLSVYQPARAAKAIRMYAKADLPQELLINRDAKGLTYLYSLLLAAKQSGAPSARVFKYLALTGVQVFIIPIVVFVALWVWYVLRTRPEPNASSFESTYLVFSTGWTAIGVVIALMYLFQTYFGMLYLYIGVISSLFMVGLTVGAAVVRRLLMAEWGEKKPAVKVNLLFFCVVALHASILALITFWPSELWRQYAFAAAFALCGICSGSYFPIAARQLSEIGVQVQQAGAKLETADHLGASVGGLATSLAIVPVLGIKATMFVLILILASNIPFAIVKLFRSQPVYYSESLGFRLRRCGYALFGLAAVIVLCSNLLAGAADRSKASRPAEIAQALAGAAKIEQATANIGPEGKKATYYKVINEKGEIGGYVFESNDLAGEVIGFGGPIALTIYVDKDGKLVDFQITASNETPAYMARLKGWQQSLKGEKLLTTEPLAKVDAVTGATVSSKAVIEALRKSGERFWSEVLGNSPETQAQKVVSKSWSYADRQSLYLAVAVIATLLVVYFGGTRSRVAVLLFNLIVGGIILNSQYSSDQLATLLSLRPGSLALAGPVLLLVGIPILVVLFGNIYCGYLCPFGAAQELLSYIVPNRFKQTVPKEAMKGGRFVKYIVLFVLVVVFFVSRNRAPLVDPLIEVFSGRIGRLLLLIVVIALIGSAFYLRFWCRYLCPVGAFLSLLNNLILLKRYIPTKKFGRCEFGISGQDSMDCIYCDRCRYQQNVILPQRVGGVKENFRARFFLVVVIAVAALVAGASLKKFGEVIPSGLAEPSVSVTYGGKARDVDVERIRKMIREGKLSDKEAQYYRKVD